jgi:uncharacterized protein (DUF2236 family)
MPSVLPSPEEIPFLVPQPGGPVWRAAGDLRTLPTAGYALLLQVAHPTVGAGVAEHSDFAADPWGRLLRTLDYVNGTIYGGPELAADIGRRVRAMHRSIKGVRPDGERYHALEPKAYAWVHATLAAAIVDGHRLLGRPLRHGDKEDFWAEWRRLGRLIGVRDQDLPESWRGFRDYFDATVERDLTDNPTVHLVLDTLDRPAVPPPGMPPRLWSLLSGPISRQMRMTTIGLLPPVLRERLGLPWSARQELALRTLGAMSRASGPFVVGPLRDFGPLYLRWRREALERGDVARPKKAMAA